MNTSIRVLAAIAFASQSFLCVNAAKAESPINSIPINSNPEIADIETSIEPENLVRGELVTSPEIALEEAIESELESSSTDESSERTVIRSRIFDTPSMCQ